MGYHKKLLEDHLNAHHPALAGDEAFIKDRLEEAEELYHRLVLEKQFSETIIHDLFLRVLFDGL